MEIQDEGNRSVGVAHQLGWPGRPLVLTFFHASLPSRGRPAAQDDSRQISLDIPDMSLLPGTGVRQMHTRTAAALGSFLLVLLCPPRVR